jgi:prepilin-type N-terminal cleavage/methylation domain-containing protein
MMRRMNLITRNLLSGTGNEGFTLVEIMMVLMILTVGVLPIAVIQHQARHEVSEADRYTQGLEVAQLHLERIKGMGFGNAVADSGAAGNIQWNAQVTNVAFGLDRVAVTAAWQNDGQQEQITLVDLVSSR